MQKQSLTVGNTDLLHIDDQDNHSINYDRVKGTQQQGHPVARGFRVKAKQ